MPRTAPKAMNAEMPAMCCMSPRAKGRMAGGQGHHRQRRVGAQPDGSPLRHPAVGPGQAAAQSAGESVTAQAPGDAEREEGSRGEAQQAPEHPAGHPEQQAARAHHHPGGRGQERPQRRRRHEGRRGKPAQGLDTPAQRGRIQHQLAPRPDPDPQGQAAGQGGSRRQAPCPSAAPGGTRRPPISAHPGAEYRPGPCPSATLADFHQRSAVL